MLERTAAKLEQSALPRSLQSRVRPRRTLHTGFWQHGAAAIDLSTQLAYPGHDTHQGSTAVSSSQGLPDQLVASTFLFDFLYPKGTVAFLRRLAPGTLDRISHLASRQPHGAFRSFTSTANGAMIAVESPRLAQNHLLSYDPDHSIQTTSRIDVVGDSTDASPTGTDVSLARIQQIVDPWATRPMSALQLINELMDRTDTECFTPAWELWNMLSHDKRSPKLRKQMIQYLHRSAKPQDAQRVLQLFSEVDVAEWSPSQLNAAVGAHLQQENLAEAFALYEAGLKDERAFVAGTGHLLHWAFHRGDWDLVCRIWDLWLIAKSRTPGTVPWESEVKESFRLRHPGAAKLPYGNLDPLLAIPNLGGRVIELGDYRAEMSATPNESGDDTRNSPEGLVPPIPVRLHGLLRVLARLAIQQPCDPAQALPLIRMAGRSWYSRYLNLVLYQGIDTGAVSQVYREYRQLPRSLFKPRSGILHRLFDVLQQENDILGLEMLHEDWVSTQGLNRGAQERFLGIYASRGDVRSLQNLWDSYVRNQDVLKQPQTFNYLLTAHSKRGNLGAVRRIFHEMAEKYNVKPDVVSWNILLKTLASLDLRDEAAETFEQLCKATSPDLFSFATMITMVGGRGDIDTALQLWERARRLKIRTDAGMLSGIVEAYCWNDRFEEAKALCINYTNKGTPGDHAHLWNCLIRHAGHKRDIRRVDQLIQLMRSRGVQWNKKTDETILDALVRCKKSAQAYQYLCKAADKNRLPAVEKLHEVVLCAAWRNREWPLVTGIYNRMVRAGFALSSQVRIAAAQAALYSPSAYQSEVAEDGSPAPQLGEVLVRHFQEFLDVDREDSGRAREEDHDQSLPFFPPNGPSGLFDKTLYVHRAAAVLARTEDVASIRRLLELYHEDMAGSPDRLTNMPLRILETTMRADLLEKKFDQVKQTWKIVLKKAVERGRSPPNASHRILPRDRQSLSGAFSLVHRVLVQEKDNSAVMALIDEVIRAGFTLSSLQWNHICHELAKNGEWVRACQICEEKLMPGWRGWRSQKIVDPHSRNYLTVEQRLLGSSPRFLRANTHTLGFLTDQYFMRRRDALFDQMAQRDIAMVKRTCPNMMFAFRTALGHSGGGFITQGNFFQSRDQDPTSGTTAM